MQLNGPCILPNFSCFPVCTLCISGKEIMLHLLKPTMESSPLILPFLKWFLPFHSIINALGQSCPQKLTFRISLKHNPGHIPPCQVSKMPPHWPRVSSWTWQGSLLWVCPFSPAWPHITLIPSKTVPTSAFFLMLLLVLYRKSSLSPLSLFNFLLSESTQR
jgi:hypothetical protein